MVRIQPQASLRPPPILLVSYSGQSKLLWAGQININIYSRKDGGFVISNKGNVISYTRLLLVGLLAADSSSISPNVVVVCCLLFVYQVEKLLANCLLTAC